MGTDNGHEALSQSLPSCIELKRTLNAGWVWSLTTILVSVAGLWFFRVAQIEFTAVVWSIFLYCGLYWLLAELTGRLANPRHLRLAGGMLQASAVVFLAYLWHLLGGIDFPMFLFVFVLPVMFTGVLLWGRWTYVLAVTSILVVSVVAALESRDLRWYLGHFQPSLQRFMQSSALQVSAAEPFRGLQTTPAFQATLLLMFAVVQILVAFFSSRFASRSVRLHQRLQESKASYWRLSLFQAIVDHSTNSSVLISEEECQVMYGNNNFFKRMLLKPEEVAGKSLFEIISFDRPEELRARMKERQGKVLFCPYRIGVEARVATVGIQSVRYSGEDYLFLSFEELTELHCLQASLQLALDPVLVMDAEKCVRYFNLTAQEQFGALYYGMEFRDWPMITQLLNDLQRAKRDDFVRETVEVDDRILEANLWGIGLASTHESHFLLWLREVERGAA